MGDVKLLNTVLKLPDYTVIRNKRYALSRPAIPIFAERWKCETALVRNVTISESEDALADFGFEINIVHITASPRDLTDLLCMSDEQIPLAQLGHHMLNAAAKEQNMERRGKLLQIVKKIDFVALLDVGIRARAAYEQEVLLLVLEGTSMPMNADAYEDENGKQMLAVFPCHNNKRHQVAANFETGVWDYAAMGTALQPYYFERRKGVALLVPVFFNLENALASAKEMWVDLPRLKAAEPAPKPAQIAHVGMDYEHDE